MPTLGGVCEAIVDCEHKTAPIAPEGFPSIRTTDIRRGRLDLQGANRVNAATYKVWSKRLEPRPRDIILAREAPVGEVGIIPPGAKVCLGQRTVLLRPDVAVVDPHYLLYLLMSEKVRHDMLTKSNGATVAHLNMRDIRALPLPDLPTIDEQRRIARVLAVLDERQDVTEKMNRTLEAMARALFRSWFVDFDPVRAKMEGRPTGLPDDVAALFPDRLVDSPLGEMPEGWEVGTLAEVARLSRDSLNPGKFPDETFDHYSLPAFDERRLPAQELGDAIKSNKSVVQDDAVLVSKLNPHIPRVWLPDLSNGARRSIASTEFLVLRPHLTRDRLWLYAACDSRGFQEALAARVTGTSGSHQRVKPEDALAVPVVLPAPLVRKVFVSAVMPLFERIALNRAQSATLTQLRDTLLPKLLSGEVRVPPDDSQEGAEA